MAAADRWQLRIDTGGTFTDGIAVDPAGVVRRVKILSSSALRGRVVRRLDERSFEIDAAWDAPAASIAGLRFRRVGEDGGGIAVESFDPATGRLRLVEPSPGDGPTFELVSDEEAPVLAARLLTGTGADEPLPPSALRLATTLGTNALLQRTGAPTVLFVTRGFGDLLRIGDQQRPDLFARVPRRSPPLHEAVVEVDERLAADGTVLTPLDLDALADAVAPLRERGLRVAAVALMHAYRNPEHERDLGAWLCERGFDYVALSSELAPRIKLLPRAETAVVDATLGPPIRGYLDRIAGTLGGGTMLVMTSAGGLLDPATYRPKDCLLSGPAGGVVGAAEAGRRAGFTRTIGFDMGGTSTDVARFDGGFEYRFDQRVGDARLMAPALAIETVAAGGGSICHLEGERLRVGPHSAGAHPGPACYGAGGPLTLTDVNLLLGRLDPAVFEIPIDRAPSERRFDELCVELERRTGRPVERRALLSGLVAIADERMADAIRAISIRRGYDPADYALVAFGGAGGQHACGVAERLGIERVVMPPDASLLSAAGLGSARVERFEEAQVLRPLEACAAGLPRRFEALSARAVDAVRAVVGDREPVDVRRRTAWLRFAGQDATLDLEWRPELDLADAFARRHVELFGHAPERRPIEVESIRVVASSARPEPVQDDRPVESYEAAPDPAGRYRRETLKPGATLPGPALVLERRSALVVGSGWSARVLADGTLLAERRADAAVDDDERDAHAAVRLELFTQRFGSIVREMGERLERTAVSTNVKERLDFSCALLDPDGQLVVNAPHIPVHLGAVGLCVRELVRRLPLAPGDVAVTNHPACGGSHLPDVTVVTPVFSADERLLGYVASRAHHAEIGGIRPGSMPPTATRLVEEGVVLPPDLLIRHGEPRFDALRRRLLEAPWPTRNVEDNLADLRAAVAANHAGAESLRTLAERHGAPAVLDAMERLQRLAEARVAEALSDLPDGDHAAEQHLDDGSRLAVRWTIDGGRATIDFTGSAPVHPGNLNATPAIVRSAVLYVLRLLLRQPLPLNEGLMRAVALVLPPGMLAPEFPDDPAACPAVVGGNVETSQRLVDTLLQALRVCACSQGTMNNLLFGNERFGYYETLGGGIGAGPEGPGGDGLHSHMTNTRITDPEILEHRYPVRVERFALRRGSGGTGRHRGGEGLLRELRFLEPVQVSLLTQHRTVAPYGMAGGGDGAPGRQCVLRADGREEALGSVDGADLAAGDRLLVETPGGGGWG